MWAQVDAVNGLHSHRVTGDQLRAAEGMVHAYWQRLGSRLSARNAQHVQMLLRVLRALGAAVAPLPAAAAAGSTGAGGEPSAVVQTVNSFLFDHEVRRLPLQEDWPACEPETAQRLPQR